MARPLRIEYPGCLYHITSRGNAQQKIFLCEKDREDFLDILSKQVKRFHWLCHAYCLMNNHYHLLIETPSPNLSRGMRQLNGIYTQRFNLIHNRTGHLFQGRYKALIVEKEAHLLELCRYIVLNPVKAGLVEELSNWSWSNFNATAGLIKCPEFLTTKWILSQFSQKKEEARKRYCDFVKKETFESPWLELKGQVVLGGKDFVKKIGKRIEDSETLTEIPKFQRYVNRPEIEEILTGEGKEERKKTIYLAHEKYSYTLKEIADFFDLHYTTVSKIIKRMET